MSGNHAPDHQWRMGLVGEHAERSVKDECLEGYLSTLEDESREREKMEFKRLNIPKMKWEELLAKANLERRRGNFWEELLRGIEFSLFYDLYESVSTPNPTERFSAEELLAHPWLNARKFRLFSGQKDLSFLKDGALLVDKIHSLSDTSNFLSKKVALFEQLVANAERDLKDFNFEGMLEKFQRRVPENYVTIAPLNEEVSFGGEDGMMPGIIEERSVESQRKIEF